MNPTKGGRALMDRIKKNVEREEACFNAKRAAIFRKEPTTIVEEVVEIPVKVKIAGDSPGVAERVLRGQRNSNTSAPVYRTELIGREVLETMTDRVLLKLKNSIYVYSHKCRKNGTEISTFSQENLEEINAVMRERSRDD